MAGGVRKRKRHATGWASSALTAILIVCAACILALGGCGGDEPAKPQAQAPVSVLVAEVRQADVPIYKEWVGVTEGLVNAQIRAQVSGYLIKQAYQEGQRVRQGQVLFLIDARPFEAGMAEAREQLADARAQHETSKATLKRIQALYKVGAVSQQILDETIGNEKSRRAEVGKAQAALEQAAIDLSFTEIVSPIDGVAGLAQAQLGDLVGPTGQPLTTVSTLDPIKAYIAISEREYFEAMRGGRENRSPEDIPLTLMLADGSTYPYQGRFSFADRSMDPTTGTIKIATLFPNPEYVLRPGQYAKVRARMRTATRALLVPQRAVNEIQGAHQVAVVGPDNKVEIRPVQVGEQVGREWIVSEGLKPGERVVAEGIQKVKQGTPVTPQPYVPEASSDGSPARPAQGAPGETEPPGREG